MELDFKEVCKHTLSASELRTFTECARKRYYTSRDFLALRSAAPNPNLQLGSAVHAWLGASYRNGTAINTVDTSQLSADDKKIFDNIVRGYVDEGYLENDLAIYNYLGDEVPFQLTNWPIEDVMFHGLIDLVLYSSVTDKYYYMEHKTCRDFRPEIYNRFDLQLHLYSIAGRREYGDQFGGIILNELKKAKTAVGFAVHRMHYDYSSEELEQFTRWIEKKTRAAVSPTNFHEPCNSYMTCKLCEFAPICLRYGYELPTDRDQLTKDGNYIYDPREDSDDN